MTIRKCKSRVFRLLASSLVVGMGVNSPQVEANQSAQDTISAMPVSGVAAEPVVAAANAKTLLTFQKVQMLSASTILKSRFLQAVDLANTILPDGSAVSKYLNLCPDSCQDAWLYRITYSSVDTEGMPTKLSGLVVVPMNMGQPGDVSDGMVIYMHATTAQRSNASGDRSTEAYGAISSFAGEKWLLVMPDYLGYGENHGTHPYALARMNAQSGLSIILAARELLTYLNFNAGALGNQINVTGYSEGGGNALGLGRALQRQANPVRIAAMSGPYDLSGATAKSFIAPQPGAKASMENFEAKPTVLAFSAVSSAKLAGQPLWSLLQDSIADQARGIFPGPYSDDDVGARLVTSAINDLDYVDGNFKPHPEHLLQPQIVKAIATHDLSNPVMKLWAENDDVNWTPNANTQIYLLGIIQDPLVPFAAKSYPLPLAYQTQHGLSAPYAEGNAQNVIMAMRKKGLGSDRVGWLGFNGLVRLKGQAETVMSHPDGFVPCAVMAAAFFKGNISLQDLPNLPDPQ